MDIFLYLDRRTFVHRLDPRTKMLALVAAFAVLLLFDHPLMELALTLGLLAMAAAARALPNVRRMLTLLLTITVFSTVVWSLFARGATRLLGPISVESFLYGLGTGLKYANVIIAGIIFLSTTKNEEILAGLIRLGLPFPVGFAFSTALRLVPTFVGSGMTIIEAQRSRGLDVESGGFFTRLRKQLPLLIPVFASSIRSTNQLSMALESKGFGARHKRTYYLQLNPGTGDYVVAVLALVAVAAAVYVNRSGFGLVQGLAR